MFEDVPNPTPKEFLQASRLVARWGAGSGGKEPAAPRTRAGKIAWELLQRLERYGHAQQAAWMLADGQCPHHFRTVMEECEWCQVVMKNLDPRVFRITLEMPPIYREGWDESIGKLRERYGEAPPEALIYRAMREAAGING